jgi:hypothetical protein
VTFAKLVVNALPAGLHGAIVILLLLRLANPGAAGAAPAGGAAAAALVLAVYTVAAAVAWALLYAALRYFASHALRLGWFQLRYVVGFHVAHGAVIAASAWTTLSRFRRSLDPATADRLAGLCLALSVAWLAAALVSTLPGVRRTAWAQLAAAALVLVAPAAAARGGGAAAPATPPDGGPAAPLPPPARRALLLNVDGADLETVLTLQAEGKLPAFARLLEEGAHGRLRSLRPCSAPVVRATLLTGRLPHRHGVRGARVRRVGGGPWIAITPAGLQFDRLLAPFLEGRDLTTGDRSVLAMHEIAARAGGRGEAAGWDADLDRDGVPAGPWTGASPAWLADFVDPDAFDPGDPRAPILIAALAAARAADEAVAADLERLAADRRPGLVAVSFPGLDAVAHLFLRAARPRRLGGVEEGGLAAYGRVLEAYYRRVDGFVGRALEAAGPDAVVFVTSTHGMEPVPLRQRLLEGGAGAVRFSGSHDGAPDGFLFARGPGIERGRRLGKGSLADAAPTVLYALGLPAARDFDGTILAGVFTRAYVFDHPVAVIGTYETTR